MNLTQEVMVLGITRYNFTNDKNELVKGTTVHFYDIAAVSEENRYGVIPQKTNLEFEAYSELHENIFPVRAVANIKVDLSKQKMKVASFDFSKK